MKPKDVPFRPVFLGPARCYHSMDWYRSCQEVCSVSPIYITDCYSGDGLEYCARPKDKIVDLFIIDKFLGKVNSRYADRWRNFVKLLAIPIQVIALRRAIGKIPNAFIFTHTVYYGFIASFAGVKYSSTPQGSEVLVRPYRSFLYRMFLRRSVQKAKFVTVDSKLMADKLQEITSVNAMIIQNGISINQCLQRNDESVHRGRTRIISIRGIAELYQIHEILAARNRSSPSIKLDFCSPIQEAVYFDKLKPLLSKQDVVLGRLDRDKLYNVLSESFCVISIPLSDSSPRSVYEAIFCGCAVVVVHNQYIDSLPKCMRERIIVVDLNDPGWFLKAIEESRKIVLRKYSPSVEAVENFDQNESMKSVLRYASELWVTWRDSRRC